jgi:hypothetical protein
MSDIFGSRENSFKAISKDLFGVDEDVVAEAILGSPNARGYIIGAISELMLKRELESMGFQVERIKEKWEGPKIHHGDFYVSVDGVEWFVIESKGLKSNSEKWAGKSKSKSQFEIFSKKKNGSAEKTWFDKLSEYEKGLFKSEPNQELIRLCQTHMPSGKSTNSSKKNGRTQASPRADEFHLLAVDMFTKTGKHEFVYAISDELSRSKKDKNHLLQNYFITLVLPSSMRPLALASPWSTDPIPMIARLKKPIDPKLKQVDSRKPGERAEGVLSF